MTIGYFGNYNSSHPRNKIFLKCLAAAGFNVVEINHREPGLRKYISLISELRARRNEMDALMVGFPGQQAMIIANFFFRKPIIFNALLSLYDAVISDRKRYGRFSFRALYFWLLDYIAFRLPDVLLFDCNAYIDYAVKEFDVARRKCKRIFLGADEGVFQPLDIPEKPLEIHYYGSFIPTHCVDTIVKAAKILENEGIRFILSGHGQCYADTLKLAKELSVKNVEFIDRLANAAELNEFINSSWITLGIFGQRPRTDRIIASKVFEALQCGKVVITSRTSAGKELLEDNQSALFVKPNDENDLAEKILALKRDESLRRQIAVGGKEQYDSKSSMKVIIRHLQDVMKIDESHFLIQ